MAYRQSQSIMIDSWLKFSQDSQASVGMLVTSSLYDSDVTQFLQRCADKQIALNLDKCHFLQTQVTLT